MAYHLKNKPEIWVNNNRVLCVDHGTKTLGLALSNSDQTMVTPMETIHRSKWAKDRDKLQKIIYDYQISQIVFGYPLNMDGTKGPRCQSVRDFVMLVEETWPDITIFFWDETLSTDAVDNLLDNDMRMTRTKRKQFKDSLAAQVILEECLSFLRRQA